MLTDEINPNNVSWDTDGTAEVPTSYGITKVYKIQSAVNLKLSEYCNLLVHDIWKLRHNDISFLGSGIYCPITLTVPPIIATSVPIIYNELQQISIDFMENKLEDISRLHMDDNSITNIEYFMLLGTVRDFRSNCVICQSNNIHEPIVFRPCGHSICTSPCLEILSKSNDFKCPICDTMVTKTFGTHDIIIPNNWNNELEYITKHFCSSKLALTGGKYIFSNIS